MHSRWSASALPGRYRSRLLFFSLITSRCAVVMSWIAAVIHLLWRVSSDDFGEQNVSARVAPNGPKIFYLACFPLFYFPFVSSLGPAVSLMKQVFQERLTLDGKLLEPRLFRGDLWLWLVCISHSSMDLLQVIFFPATKTLGASSRYIAFDVVEILTEFYIIFSFHVLVPLYLRLAFLVSSEAEDKIRSWVAFCLPERIDPELAEVMGCRGIESPLQQHRNVTASSMLSEILSFDLFGKHLLVLNRLLRLAVIPLAISLGYFGSQILFFVVLRFSVKGSLASSLEFLPFFVWSLVVLSGAITAQQRLSSLFELMHRAAFTAHCGHGLVHRADLLWETRRDAAGAARIYRAEIFAQLFETDDNIKGTGVSLATHGVRGGLRSAMTGSSAGETSDSSQQDSLEHVRMLLSTLECTQRPAFTILGMVATPALVPRLATILASLFIALVQIFFARIQPEV